jgi:hypothetical protein
MGSPKIKIASDGWSIVTLDKKVSGMFEDRKSVV